MSKKVKVAAIQIQYPDGRVEQLLIEDAKALYEQLGDLFGEKESPPAPIIIERERYPRWRPLIGTPPIEIGDNTSPYERPQVWFCEGDQVSTLG